MMRSPDLTPVLGLLAAMSMVALACSSAGSEPSAGAALPPAVTTAPTDTLTPTQTSTATPAAASSAPARIDGTFNIGGRSLYLACVGAGSPTIILEPGDGDPNSMMDPLVAPLSRSHLVCTYDRANTGSSDAAPTPRPARQLAEDLHALLATAEIPGPYLPVGTSLGGMVAFMYSSLYPDDVVGFVSINPPPNPENWLPAVAPRLTAVQIADEEDYGYGVAGSEHVDQRGWLDVATPADDLPYDIVDSSDTQCEGDPLCLKVYDIIETQTKGMAARGASGRWLQIAGSHQLQLSNTPEVLQLIEDLALSR